MSQISFFATKEDLLPVLIDIEERRPVKYAPVGTVPKSGPETWRTGTDLPHIGEATADQAINCDPFLVLDEAAGVRVRLITTIDGRKTYEVDQLFNPDTIMLFPGGEWRKGDAIIAGKFATI